MNKVPYDYHIHTDFCDGKAKAEEFIKKAVEHKMEIIGFSSHGPVPFKTDWTMKEKDFPEYIKEINGLRNRYRNKIRILIGLEVDYIPGIFSCKSSIIKNAGLDYTLGSVHFLGQMKDGFRWTVDGPFEETDSGIKYTFGGDGKAAAEAYYDRISEMVRTAPPDIIGHFDLIKINNRNNYLFSEDEQWYRKLVEATFDVIAESECVIEVNTGGITRKKIDALYPSVWIIRECFEKNIPMIINSDSHSPEHLGGSFDYALTEVKKAGYRKLVRFTEKGKEIYSI